MKIAAVTSYFNEPDEMLKRCMDSVQAQTIATDHFLISNGPKRDLIARNDLIHVSVGKTHRNFANTPRAIGAMMAISRDYDALFFLDPNYTIEPNHVSACLTSAVDDPSVDYVIASQKYLRPNGSQLQFREDPLHQILGLNCLFLFPGSYHLVPILNLIPKQLSIFGDRIFLAALTYHRLKFSIAFTNSVNQYSMNHKLYTHLNEGPIFEGNDSDLTEVNDWLSKLTKHENDLLSRRLGFVLNWRFNENGYLFWGTSRT